MALQWPLVGRQAELEQITTLIGEAAQGRGGLLLLGGEAGIGKTSLVHAACEAYGKLPHTGTRLTVATGRSPGDGETPTLWPWTELVAELTRRGAGDSRNLPQPLGDGPGDAHAVPLAAAVLQWLVQTGMPLLLILEDIHWADPATLDLIRHIAPRLGQAPVLLLATYRTDEVHRGHPLWTLLPELQRTNARRMLLGRLAAEAVASLSAAALPSVADPAAVAARLYERTGGHPLFVRELLQAAAETGALPETLPETLQQAIDRTIGRLSEGTVRVLQAAAVAGEQFGYDLLSRVLALPEEEELLAALEEAVTAHVLRAEDAAGEHFTFSHALVREALLQQLIGPRRRRWHARTAEALLAGGGGTEPEAVALHFARAGDARALPYLLQAAERADGIGALLQAIRLYEQALAFVPEADPLRPELLLRLGWAMRYEYHKSSQEHLQAAAALAEAQGRRALAVWARHRLAEALEVDRDLRCLPLMEQVQAEEEALLGDPEFQALGPVAGFPPIAASRALTLTRAGRIPEALALTEAMLARLTPGAAVPIAFDMARWYGLFTTGQVAGALAAVRRARETALSQGMLLEALLADFGCACALAFAGLGDADEVDAAFRVTERLDAEFQRRAVVSDPWYGLGPYQWLRGDWARAYATLVGFLDRHRQGPNSLVLWFGAELQLSRGAVDWVESLLQGVTHPTSAADDPEYVEFHPLYQVMRAQCLLARGDLTAARAWLESADRWCSLRPMLPFEPMVKLAWAAYHRQTGDLPAALSVVRAALAQGEATGNLLAVIRARRLAAELACEAGRPGEAEPHLRAALELAERCRLPYEVALTQLVRAQRFPAAAGAREGLEAARQTFERLGATPALAEATAVGTAYPDGLTAREVEVLRLVAQGLTDKEVGARLFISPRTVDGHLRNIFAKAGVSTRSALAAYAARQRLLADEAAAERK